MWYLGGRKARQRTEPLRKLLAAGRLQAALAVQLQQLEARQRIHGLDTPAILDRQGAEQPYGLGVPGLAPHGRIPGSGSVLGRR